MTDFITKYPWTAVTMNRVEPWREIGSGWFDDIDEWCPGWMTIIENAIDKVQKLINDHPDSNVQIQQFKEKFGSIRLYVVCDVDIMNDVHAIIQELEESSMHTCMHCGANGKIRGNHAYIQCLCDKCVNQQ